MEVHAHAHPPAAGHHKKWTHYLWEFLMLFLAVFCGFLAENFREHMVEHQREKKYMRSMVEDLMQDTARIRQTIDGFETSLIPTLDTSMKILYYKDFSDVAVRHELYEFLPLCYRFGSFSPQDRTMNQLQNSGNFRLIRNSVVTDSLAAYWNSMNALVGTMLPGYDAARLKAKDMILSVINYKYYEQYTAVNSAIRPGPLELLSDDKKQLTRLANYIANLLAQAKGPIIGSLHALHRKATNLISLVKTAYHLK